jgi:hypothetical protein
MSALQRIAYFQHRRDEVPNQELAKELAAKKDRKGIREIAENLWKENSQIQSDCLKVLYEIGYLQPELIVPYADDFLKLLHSRNNRLVWGAMIALSTVADLKADAIYLHVEEIKQVMAQGSVITKDNGVNARNKQQFIAVLEKRLVDLSSSQAARVKKVIEEAEQR